MPHGRGGETSVRVTTVVAVADSVVRLQTLLQPDANPALADEALSMGRTLTGPPANKAQSDQDLRQLQQGTLKPKPKTIHSHAPSATLNLPQRRKGNPGTPGNAGGASVQVNGGGEIEAAASMDGQNLLTDAGCSISYSTNGGASVTASAV